ncbi:alpha/beta hydrolase [Nocardioides marmoriginsengisoli]|uniref:Alpha/beta hydrolase n=1 Tax=Nocardioides marmoriginsengisoli TaxID=661483 RepID=A0A3N0CT32_9ACTN|nr:alpha/beta hydrolase [Nocardioides marmoriginsengisoli]RNL66156.1 alpha/beta hydrolase [Nocardioides marmoriginsengisoli]
MIALVSAAAVAASIAGFSGAQAAPAAPAVGGFTPTLSAWGECAEDIECSTLTVPLDYANPDNGKTVKLALARAAATGPASSYQGILVANPGGPGGEGRGLAGFLKGSIAGASTYDVIGFDPRGVGASVPALRCNSKYFGVNRPNYVPKTKKLLTYWLTKTKRYAQQCGRSSAAVQGLLPFMTTRDVAKDVESLRVAYQAQLASNVLTASKAPKLDALNFYGFSYGTYIAQVYATLYPTRVGRFVLDGVVDPTRWWYGGNIEQEIGFDRNINIYFKWLAAHNKTFHLGTSAKKIRKGYYAMLKKLDRRPAAKKRLGPDELNDALVSAGYYIYDWVAIGHAYSALVRRGNGNPLFRMYRDGNMGDDNGYAVYLGVQCSDVKRPTWAKQKADAVRLHKKHPFLTWNNTWYNAPCLKWPAPSRARVNVTGSGVSGKILLVSETKDAATSYSGALRVRGLFANSRLIAGIGGTTHSSSLSGVACVDNRIDAFFKTGALPARQSGRRADVNCPKLAPPSVSGSSRVSAGAWTQPLHRLLMQAQRPSVR